MRKINARVSQKMIIFEIIPKGLFLIDRESGKPAKEALLFTLKDQSRLTRGCVYVQYNT